MQAFLDYISFEAVAEVLISKRVQLADKRHKNHMLHLMSPKMSLGMLTDAERQLLSLLPSRKHWVTIPVFAGPFRAVVRIFISPNFSTSCGYFNCTSADLLMCLSAYFTP